MSYEHSQAAKIKRLQTAVGEMMEQIITLGDELDSVTRTHHVEESIEDYGLTPEDMQ